MMGVGLRSLDRIKPLYLLPDDSFAEDCLIPCFSRAENVDAMFGYFSSAALAHIAPGLASFISDTSGKMRMVVSPHLQKADWEAIQEGRTTVGAVATDKLREWFITEDEIQAHTLQCLSWMIRHGRLEIRIALVKNGLFHPKVWLFRDVDDDWIVTHGSSNLTEQGMDGNIEQVAVARSWSDSDGDLGVSNSLNNLFHNLWIDQHDNCIVVDIPEAVRDRLVSVYELETPPSEVDLRAIYRRAASRRQVMDNRVDTQLPAFSIPSHLEYRSGPFKHQGEAVDAWHSAGRRGVLEMATGSGKTIAAMIAAYGLYQDVDSLLIVVAAPYVPLVQQWCDEIRPFGINPIDLTAQSGSKARARTLNRIERRLRRRAGGVEAVVVTHRTLSAPDFQDAVSRMDTSTLLIGDEVHGLGSEGFISDPPEFFDHRLGLSATPIRQYDAEGTEALFDFFGETVYQFTLDQAIGVCLVPYDYFVHPVELTEDEMDRWAELTDKIRQNSWREDEEPGAYIQKLLIGRRAVLENASNKLDTLLSVLEDEGPRGLRHTLVYATDKAPDQLERVNRILRDLDVRFQQLTYEESGDRALTKQIIDLFQRGDLQVLTAKRVLDEGVNIPQIQKAFILASTTVERQWVQRRGRLLRKCDEIGKTHSEIHDFIALPPNLQVLDRDSRRLVESELKRVQEFARLARNAGLPGGPLDIIKTLIEAAYL